MANAQSAQEELQQSVVLSEEDAEYEEDDTLEAMHIDGTSTAQVGDLAGAEVVTLESTEFSTTADLSIEGEHDNHANHDGKLNNDVPLESQEDAVIRADAEGEPEDDEDLSHADDGSESQSLTNHYEDGGSDRDAEGEDDDMPTLNPNDVVSGDENEDDEEDEAEGVGAVKIKPGDTDEDESESDDDASFASAASDRDSADEWEAAAENEDDEDEDSDAAASTICIFCKKDEENDPGEEFESFLVCKSCGEHCMF
jgi:histone acetyltransferase SAS3